MVVEEREYRYATLAEKKPVIILSHVISDSAAYVVSCLW
jgi:hypothetical protein